MTGQRTLPKTRIASLFIYLNTLSAFMVGAAALFGLSVPMEGRLLHWHILTGLGAVVLGMFGIVSAMFYLVITGQAVKEAVQKHHLPVALFDRTRGFKKRMFPWCMGTVALLITMTVLGGAVHVEKVSKYVHLGFAIVTIAAYAMTVKSIKRNFHESTVLLADTIEAVDAVSAPPRDH